MTPAAHIVLVVDDEPALLRLLLPLLGRAGYEVESASDGDEALSQLEEHGARIGAAVIDATVAPSGAVTLVQRLRALDPPPGVVVMSGGELDPEIGDLLAQCGGRFVAKPFALAEISEAVAAVWKAGR